MQIKETKVKREEIEDKSIRIATYRSDGWGGNDRKQRGDYVKSKTNRR